MDERYAYPLYQFRVGISRKEQLKMGEALLATGKLTDFIELMPNRSWYGLVFDEKGFPLYTALWDEKNGVRGTSDMLANNMEEISEVYDRFQDYVSRVTNLFVVTNEMRQELLSRGLDLNHTKVIGGIFDDFGYIFSDGTHEVILFLSEGIGTSWGYRVYLTAEEYANELIRRNTPEAIRDDRLDYLTQIDSIRISNGTTYKNIENTKDMQRIMELMKNYDVLYDKAEVRLDAAVTILINDCEMFSFSEQDGTYYYCSNSVGYCMAEPDWVKSVLEIYEQLDYEEHPDEEFQQIVNDNRPNPVTGKPVIYLYPEQETQVTVNLDFDGKITYTYPAYYNSWNVTAYPDGRIVNKVDGSEYSYLFWEGISPHKWNFDTGFVVKGQDTESFLRDKLSYMGLTAKEYNDFIVYWVPKMQDNPYNQIAFSPLHEYAQVATLDIMPRPDSILRIHMAWKALQTPVEIAEQELQAFVRNGFTVVEWGGTEVR